MLLSERLALGEQNQENQCTPYTVTHILTLDPYVRLCNGTESFLNILILRNVLNIVII